MKRSQEIVRQWLAGLVVPGELLQHLRLLLPVLVELRGQFDEIGEHAGAGQRGIGDVRQHPVQPMAEFVEQGPGIVGRQQGWLALGPLGEIADIDDQRRDIAVELLLVPQRGHPGARAFRGSGEVVAIEQRLMPALAVPDFPDPDVRMPDRDIPALGEAEAEQPACAVERGLDHVVERQIGLDRGVIKIGAALPQLLGVEAPVPWRQREIATLLRDQRLQGIAIRERPGARRLPDPLQQAAHRLRRLRHRILQPVGGEGRKAQ